MTYGLHSGVLYIPSKRELLCSWVPCGSATFFGPCPHRRPVLYALDSTARPSSAAARWIQTSCLSVWQEVHIGVTQDLRLHPSRRSNFCSSWLLGRFLDGLRDTSSSSFYSQPIRLPSTTIWLTPCELFRNFYSLVPPPYVSIGNSPLPIF